MLRGNSIRWRNSVPSLPGSHPRISKANHPGDTDWVHDFASEVFKSMALRWRSQISTNSVEFILQQWLTNDPISNASLWIQVYDVKGTWDLLCILGEGKATVSARCMWTHQREFEIFWSLPSTEFNNVGNESSTHSKSNITIRLILSYFWLHSIQDFLGR